MNTKVIVSGVIAAIVMFLLGWLIYGVLMADLFPMDEEPTAMAMVWMFLSNLFWGLLLSYVLITHAGSSNAMDGAKIGAIIGILAGLSIDSFHMSMGHMTMNQMVADVIAGTVMAGIAGAVIGWYNGRGAAASA